jgi:Protein of unknown function (DUF2855)
MENTLLTSHTEFSSAHWHSTVAKALAAGQIRCRVERFAFTANNVTYAAFGQAMRYWQFYPSGVEGFGVIPVWGFATVVESRCDGVAVGTRLYGYWPFGSHAVLQPARVSAHAFMDASPHRVELAAVYNRYVFCSTDPFYHAGQEGISALLRPLFITSWLIDDFLADNQDFGGQAILMSSASSKTAYGFAHALQQRSGTRPQAIGLTSAANKAFCQSLGCYDQVLTYEELPQLQATTPCVYVDFAGNAALRQTIHSHFSQLRYSCSVGGTHVESLGNAKGLSGPKPTLFFAPAQIQKRRDDWGAAQLDARLLAAWNGFISRVTHAAAPWLTVQTHSGKDAALAAYQLVLQGESNPALGHVIDLPAA